MRFAAMAFVVLGLLGPIAVAAAPAGAAPASTPAATSTAPDPTPVGEVLHFLLTRPDEEPFCC
jgi:hypothetical protein